MRPVEKPEIIQARSNESINHPLAMGKRKHIDMEKRESTGYDYLIECGGQENKKEVKDG